MKIQEIPIKDIIIIENHRVDIHKTNLDELMRSIKDHGLLQPIGVTIDKNNKYSLLYGQRRLLACQKLGHLNIPAVVGDIKELKELLLVNVTENIQRKDPSYLEYGRVIEKLTKMNMSPDEISARLGIDRDKVLTIIATYNELPAKHREKVEFMGKGGRKQKGDNIPAGMALQIIRMKNQFRLNPKQVDLLLNEARKDTLTKEDLGNLCILLKNDVPLEEAIDKIHDYFVYHIDFVCHRTEVGKRMIEAELSSAQILFRRILYGKAPSLKKPDFIKV